MDNWISVEDELPEFFEDVLIVNEDGVRVACKLNVPEGSFYSWDNASDSCGCCDSFDQNVTYWQPLPPPPKGEGE